MEKKKSINENIPAEELESANGGTPPTLDAFREIMKRDGPILPRRLRTDERP
jgi:hypothetical protein